MSQLITEQGYYEESAPLQRSSTRYAVSECVFAASTDYAQTVIVNNPDYGRMLFLDSELQSSSYDENIYHETLVHPALNALSRIDNRVLVIGGAEGATVREVLKWNKKVRRIDWVDIDKTLVDVCKTHLQYADPHSEVYKESGMVKFYAQDIMVFLANCNRPKYDCIIIDLPDPDPLGNGDLYSSKFWTGIKNALLPGGTIVSHVGPVEPGFGRQSGLDFVVKGTEMVGLGPGRAYHTFIPSFQSEWGFWMCGVAIKEFSDEMVSKFTIINSDYQKTIFHWDKHWNCGT